MKASPDRRTKSQAVQEMKAKFDPSVEPLSRLLLDDSYRKPKALTFDSKLNQIQESEGAGRGSISSFLPEIYMSQQRRKSQYTSKTSPKWESTAEDLVPAFESDVPRTIRSLVPSEEAMMKAIPHVKQLETSRHSSKATPVSEDLRASYHESFDSDFLSPSSPGLSASLDEWEQEEIHTNADQTPGTTSPKPSAAASAPPNRSSPRSSSRTGGSPAPSPSPTSTSRKDDQTFQRVHLTPLQKERSCEIGLFKQSSVPAGSPGLARTPSVDSRKHHEVAQALQRLESEKLEAQIDISQIVRSSIVLSRLPVFKSLLKVPATRTHDDVTRIRGLLSVCGPLRGLSLDLMSAVCKKVVLKQFKQEDFCVREGDAADTYFVILAGQVNVYEGRVDGVPVRRLGPGEGFGELAILERGAHRASLKVQDQMGLVVACLSSEDYDGLLRTLHTTTNLYHAGWS